MNKVRFAFFVSIISLFILSASSVLFLMAFKIPFSGKVYVCTPVVKQGEIIQILVNGCPRNEKLIVTFNSKRYEILPAENNLRAIIGVPVNIQPGDYEVFMEYKRFNMNRAEFVGKVTIEKRKYKKEKLKFSKKKNDWYEKSRKSIKHQADKILLEQTYKTISYDQLWEGKFQLPVKRKITSPFGAERVYSLGGGFNSCHLGVDFSAPAGTKIYAANSGRVILSKYLVMSGNMVGIDHGQGVISLYKHMSKLKVEEGQKISKGDLIGLSGSSGISTGAHLHWEIRVHGVPVNPFKFTEKKL